MKKKLFEVLRKSICQNLTQKILLVFAFLFFRPVFAQLYVEKSHNKTKTEHKSSTTKKIKDIPLYVFYSSCPDGQSYSIFSGKRIAATADNFHWVSINGGNEEVVSSHFGFEKAGKIPSKNGNLETCKVSQNSSRAPPVC